jgi:hypothetical protein
VCGADNCQIYNNTIHHTQTDSGGGWGHGIFVNSDGDGAGNGKAITSCLIYNNVIYAMSGSGIRMTATVNANISGVRILNNTIFGSQSAQGVDLFSSGANTITIAAFQNNVVASDALFDMNLSANVTITSCDYNLYNRAAQNSWAVNGVSQTWAQWQALGYDAHGVQNSDPKFIDSAGNFHLQISSPAINTGLSQASYFTVDRDGLIRPQGVAWDIGAYELPQVMAGVTGVAVPVNGLIPGLSGLKP